MVAIIITLCVLLIASVVVLKWQAEKISRMEHLMERKQHLVKAQQRRIYELTGIVQRAQRIIDEGK